MKTPKTSPTTAVAGGTTTALASRLGMACSCYAPRR